MWKTPYSHEADFIWWEKNIIECVGGELCRKGPFTRTVSHSVSYPDNAKVKKTAETRGKYLLLEAEKPQRSVSVVNENIVRG